ncbi:phage tail tip lysozyme [Limosilactobacillus mucosae]|jgi:murein DD-endopeptidase MepM/ murein hydrolase activator NlpD|uniref:phage tail tip lysozyme n=1 Tax=Limosilactobacillus mucosae TaxID=97478 RepID=UPI00025042DB|nr:phage tail tip lysozyme [Limosilactobacillus mucosae]
MGKKKYWVLGGIGAGIIAFLIVIMAILTLFSSKSCKSGGDSDAGDTSSGGAGGSWTQQGTDAYKNAEAVFKYWTGKGMSGAQAAGIVGNITVEDPGFVLDQAEIGAGAEGGGGLYQFTPKSKYLTDPKSDKSWSVQNQGDVILNSAMSAVKQFMKETKGGTPEDAATVWMNTYELPAASERVRTNSARRSGARKAYEMFGGANISGSDSILGDATGTADSGSNTQNDENQCSTSSGDGAGGDWSWPFASIKNNNPGLSAEQQFGYSASRTGNFHDGIDLGDIPYGGQEIKAIHGGKVYKIGHKGYTQSDLGYYICVKSDDGYYEVYQEFAFSEAQAAKYIKVKEGDTVKTGDVIGTLPKHGSENSPAVTHIHIGVSKTEITKAEDSAFSNNGTWLDPVDLIKGGQSKK